MSGPSRTGPSFPEPFNLFTGIRYAADHFTVEFTAKDGTPATCTFGVVDDRFEYTVTGSGATWRDEDRDFTIRFYTLRNRAGEEFRFQMLVAPDAIEEFVADEFAYVQALKAKVSPKSDAAVIPYVVQQAAFSLGQAA